MAPSSGVGALWRNRAFNIFWIGESISLIGSAMAGIALPLLVFEATGSIKEMGIVAALSSVGGLLASLVGGLLADRVNRRYLLIWCDSLNALCYAAIPVTWWLFGPQVNLLLALAAPLGFLGVTFFIGYSSTITNLVERDQLTTANSRLQTMTAIATIIGPLLAGLMVASYGAVSVMSVNALSFFASVIAVAIIRLKYIAAPPTVEKRDGLVRQAFAGLRFVGAQPTLRWMVVVRSGMFVLTGGVYAIFIFRLRHDLHVAEGTIGVIFGVGALGAVVCSLVAPWIRSHLGFGWCFLGGTAVIGLSVVLRGLVSDPYLFMGLTMLATFADTLVVINTMSLRHALTPDNLQGRVTAFLQMATFVLTPLSTTLFTFLAASLGTQLVLVLMGSLVLALVALGLFTPVVLRRPEQAQVPVVTS